MKQSVKRALDYLEAVGFKSEPHPYKPATHSVHWHANEPETKLTVFAGMADAAASKLVKHAEAIVGLATTESDAAQKKAKRETKAKKHEAAEREKQIKAAEHLAATKDADAKKRQRRQYQARQNKGALTKDDQLAILDAITGELITPYRISDELCISEQVVRDAIESYELVAQVHPGKRLLCTVADVRQWVMSKDRET